MEPKLSEKVVQKIIDLSLLSPQFVQIDSSIIHPTVDFDQLLLSHPQFFNEQHVPESRLTRKRQQLQSLIKYVTVFIDAFLCHRSNHRRRRRDPASSASESAIHVEVVDFCGGCGHVGLALALLYPQCRVTIADFNPVSLQRAERRARELKLRNLQTWCGDVADWERPFDVGVALHACGLASDLALLKSCQWGKAFCVVPCCVGGVAMKLEDNKVESMAQLKTQDSQQDTVPQQQQPSGSQQEGTPQRKQLNVSTCTPQQHYQTSKQALQINGLNATGPKSDRLKNTISDDEFIRLSRAADYSDQQLSLLSLWRIAAKEILEMDRLLWVTQNQGWTCRLAKLMPLECTPKNDVLIGHRRLKRSDESHMDHDGISDDDEEKEESEDYFTSVFVPKIQFRPAYDQLSTHDQWSYVDTRIKDALDDFAKDKDQHSLILDWLDGPYSRKMAHYWAETLGLAHKSQGKGKNRVVTISKS